jgi:trehalose 6-phosphate synthase
MTNGSDKRLVIISNRLPVVINREGDEWIVTPSSGGLVTALAPVLRDRGGIWIGWPGTLDEVDLTEPLKKGAADAGYKLFPVLLTKEEHDNFYYGFANEVIWPLFHDLQDRCKFEPEYWLAYEKVNEKFATAIAENTKADDTIWIHDYHLMNVAASLRKNGVETPLGFFLHIPFPQLDIFLKLPWRSEILSALLEYDLIGLQTVRDRRNFVQCVSSLIHGVEIQEEEDGRMAEIRMGDRRVRVGAFPISIDYDSFERVAQTKEVSDRAWFIHEDLPRRHIIIGVDRMDYTKGIPFRLEAFRNALVRYPELREQITLVQVVVPSRAEIPEYMELKMRIERLISEINGEFTVSGWVPIIYISRFLEKNELLGWYRTSEIALITPLKDGMNLVAKEYCACSVDENSVLILSEFAGAAAEMQNHALLVNPYHIESVSDAIYQAFMMSPEEKRSRMSALREQIRNNNVFNWVDSFLHAAFGKELGAFEPVTDYLPVVEWDSQNSE